MDETRTISQDTALCIANAIRISAYMGEYATVYRNNGAYAFRLSGDPRPLVSDHIVWSTDPQMRDRAIVFSRGQMAVMNDKAD
jgi:hypothetical protein